MKQAAEMKHSCIHFNPYFSCAVYPAKVKYMQSVCVSSQLLVSVLFIVVPTNTHPWMSLLYCTIPA